MNRLLQLALMDAQQGKSNLFLLQEKLNKAKLDFLHLNNENTDLIMNARMLSAQLREGEATAVRLAREVQDREVTIISEGDLLRKEVKRIGTENAVLVDNLEFLRGIKEENSRNEDRIEALKDDIKDMAVSDNLTIFYCINSRVFLWNSQHIFVSDIVPVTE